MPRDARIRVSWGILRRVKPDAPSKPLRTRGGSDIPLPARPLRPAAGSSCSVRCAVLGWCRRLPKRRVKCRGRAGSPCWIRPRIATAVTTAIATAAAVIRSWFWRAHSRRCARWHGRRWTTSGRWGCRIPPRLLPVWRNSPARWTICSLLCSHHHHLIHSSKSEPACLGSSRHPTSTHGKDHARTATFSCDHVCPCDGNCQARRCTGSYRQPQQRRTQDRATTPQPPESAFQ
jgi:hypothetical protein